MTFDALTTTYGLSQYTITNALSAARLRGWAATARLAGRKLAQRAVAIDKALAADRAGSPAYVADRHQSVADSHETGWALLTFCARMVRS